MKKTCHFNLLFFKSLIYRVCTHHREITPVLMVTQSSCQGWALIFILWRGLHVTYRVRNHLKSSGNMVSGTFWRIPGRHDYFGKHVSKTCDLQALSGLWPNLKEPFNGDRTSLVWIFILEYPSGIAMSGNPWIYNKILFYIHAQIQS